jgi:hypothetical protein
MEATWAYFAFLGPADVLGHKGFKRIFYEFPHEKSSLKRRG